MATKKNEQAEIEIPRLDRETAEFFLVGETPLIFNQMSEKAKRDLIAPPGRKTAAQKKTTLKHDPVAEYRASAYTLDDEEAPTLLCMPSTAFKKAMANAAVDIPGSSRAAIGRLVRVHGYRVGIYGTPFLKMDVVRMADINKTPDVRTRAILPEWCCVLQISYVRPLLGVSAIANLLAGAGELIGIGDFRQQKGAGDFGLFRVTTSEDKDYLRIVKQGREAQTLGLKDPQMFDHETEELLAWYDETIANR